MIAYGCVEAWELLKEACLEGDLKFADRLVRMFDFFAAPVDERSWNAIRLACGAGHLAVARRLASCAGAGGAELGRLVFREACGLGRLGTACWAASLYCLTPATAAAAGEDAADVHPMRGALRGMHLGTALWLQARFGFTTDAAIGDQESDEDD
ncbi:MAG TPA: hypothetical protein VNI01_02950 [Elusimicrobiota bacterium]|nr:hypothetical protein [Elusimicrobiota bacterium]